jgi:hypothetical protein
MFLKLLSKISPHQIFVPSHLNIWFQSCSLPHMTQIPSSLFLLNHESHIFVIKKRDSLLDHGQSGRRRWQKYAYSFCWQQGVETYTN